MAGACFLKSPCGHWQEEKSSPLPVSPRPAEWSLQWHSGGNEKLPAASLFHWELAEWRGSREVEGRLWIVAVSIGGDQWMGLWLELGAVSTIVQTELHGVHRFYSQPASQCVCVLKGVKQLFGWASEIKGVHFYQGPVNDLPETLHIPLLLTSKAGLKRKNFT